MKEISFAAVSYPSSGSEGFAQQSCSSQPLSHPHISSATLNVNMHMDIGERGREIYLGLSEHAKKENYFMAKPMLN